MLNYELIKKIQKKFAHRKKKFLPTRKKKNQHTQKIKKNFFLQEIPILIKFFQHKNENYFFQLENFKNKLEKIQFCWVETKKKKKKV